VVYKLNLNKELWVEHVINYLREGEVRASHKSGFKSTMCKLKFYAQKGSNLK